MKKFFTFFAVAAALCVFASCNEENANKGTNLPDPPGKEEHLSALEAVLRLEPH